MTETHHHLTTALRHLSPETTLSDLERANLRAWMHRYNAELIAQQYGVTAAVVRRWVFCRWLIAQGRMDG